MKNIALIGFMGSGKTTLAAILASKLQMELREIDEDIVRISDYSSVTQIFAEKGEDYFRKLEKNVVEEVANKPNQVISCGGGVVSSHEVMNLLKKNTTLVFLQTDFKTITQRLEGSDSRPLFKDVEKALALYAQRLPLYEKYADIKIETDNQTPEQVAGEIIEKLNIRTGIKTCVVIGDPISHSLSPAMHNAAFKELGINKQYSFKTEQVKPSGLASYISKVRKENIYMLAVTIPHKETIGQYLDKLDDTAKEIGAVNTVINKDSVLTGYNTDCPGAMNALKKHTKLDGKAVVVLGSGGTAKAIAYGLYKEKVRAIICSRNMAEAQKIAGKYNFVAFPWEGIGNVAMADIIINTTPIGRQGEKFPYIIENMIDNQKARGAEKQIVFDVNYNAEGIPLLKDAQKIGTVVIDGLELLLQQGILQFELYTGLSAPIETMRKTLQKIRQYEYAG